MENSSPKTITRKKSIDELMKEDAFVWFLDSSGRPNVGRVQSFDKTKREAVVFNLDVWADWIISYDDIKKLNIHYL